MTKPGFRILIETIIDPPEEMEDEEIKARAMEFYKLLDPERVTVTITLDPE